MLALMMMLIGLFKTRNNKQASMYTALLIVLKPDMIDGLRVLRVSRLLSDKELYRYIRNSICQSRVKQIKSFAENRAKVIVLTVFEGVPNTLMHIFLYQFLPFLFMIY